MLCWKIDSWYQWLATTQHAIPRGLAFEDAVLEYYSLTVNRSRFRSMPLLVRGRMWKRLDPNNLLPSSGSPLGHAKDLIPSLDGATMGQLHAYLSAPPSSKQWKMRLWCRQIQSCGILPCHELRVLEDSYSGIQKGSASVVCPTCFWLGSGDGGEMMQ